MHILKTTLKAIYAFLLFASGLAATGLAMAVVGLFLVGLVDWTSSQQSLRVQPVTGASEDVRADYLPPAEPKTRGFSVQLTERPVQ